MRQRTVLIVAALAAGAVATLAIGSYAGAQSGKSNVKTEAMIGYLEAPPVSTAAHGSFEAHIDDGGDVVRYTLEYSGLEGDIRQAHIHFGQRSVSAGIIVWLCETAQNQSPSPDTTPDCPQSGSVSDSVGPSDVIGPAGQGIAAGEFEEFVAALRAGRGYANVHTTKFPGGEIRGQINDRNQKDD